ncbi:MAG: FHA domain-containing protein [Chloroflexi bacterium]|nr:FHA domain-containing protein [Chloroflexota bacterium]
MTNSKTLRAIFPDVKPPLYVLDECGCVLGRSTDCGIVVARPFASRMHARIQWDGHYHVLEDNQSANGTYVNGRRLQAPHKLKNGDEIGLGDPTGLVSYLDEDNTVRPVLRLSFDPRHWRFVWDAQPLALTSDQLSLLLALYDRRGELCDRALCAQAVWGRDYDSYMDADALDQIASRLRARLRQTSPEAADLVITLRGQGYMLKHG